MRGTGCFFITPKENFKHLMSHNPQNVTLRFVESHYNVDVLGEWWEGTGFWIAEAIFAYINPELVTDDSGDGGEGGEGGEGEHRQKECLFHCVSVFVRPNLCFLRLYRR
jgi:hypothetical protein